MEAVFSVPSFRARNSYSCSLYFAMWGPTRAQLANICGQSEHSSLFFALCSPSLPQQSNGAELSRCFYHLKSGQPGVGLFFTTVCRYRSWRTRLHVLWVVGKVLHLLLTSEICTNHAVIISCPACTFLTSACQSLNKKVPFCPILDCNLKQSTNKVMRISRQNSAMRELQFNRCKHRSVHNRKQRSLPKYSYLYNI